MTHLGRVTTHLRHEFGKDYFLKRRLAARSLIEDACESLMCAHCGRSGRETALHLSTPTDRLRPGSTISTMATHASGIKTILKVIETASTPTCERCWAEGGGRPIIHHGVVEGVEVGRFCARCTPLAKAIIRQLSALIAKD